MREYPELDVLYLSEKRKRQALGQLNQLDDQLEVETDPATRRKLQRRKRSLLVSMSNLDPDNRHRDTKLGGGGPNLPIA